MRFELTERRVQLNSQTGSNSVWNQLTGTQRDAVQCARCRNHLLDERCQRLGQISTRYYQREEGTLRDCPDQSERRRQTEHYVPGIQDPWRGRESDETLDDEGEEAMLRQSIGSGFLRGYGADERARNLFSDS